MSLMVNILRASDFGLGGGFSQVLQIPQPVKTG